MPHNLILWANSFNWHCDWFKDNWRFYQCCEFIINVCHSSFVCVIVVLALMNFVFLLKIIRRLYGATVREIEGGIGELGGAGRGGRRHNTR